MNKYVLAVTSSMLSFCLINASDFASDFDMLESCAAFDFTVEAPVVKATTPVSLVKNGKPQLLQPGQKMPSVHEQSRAVVQQHKDHYARLEGKTKFEALKNYAKNHKVAVATGVVVTAAAVYGVYKFVTYVKAKRAEKALILAELKNMQAAA